MKVLVTGSEGFVGKYLVDKLKSEGIDVEGGYFSPRPNYDIPVHFLNVTDKDSIKEVLKTDYDAVIHLAAQSSGSVAFREIELTYDVNTGGTLNLLNSLREKEKNVHFIYVSTAEVYGTPRELPIREIHNTLPVNHYAVSKYNAENIVRVFDKIYDFIKVTILRPFNHTGPGQRDIFVLPSFARQIAEIEKGKREPVLYTGNLSVKRDFTDVRDIVNAYYKVLINGIEGIYNVASGKSYSIEWLLDKMIELSGINIDIKTDPDRLRPVDIPVLYGDYTLLNKKTGWQPEIPIEDTLKSLLDYWRAHE